eukprot:CAMPEP_0174260764 /NCGR_PEP_ID=MMETSP0439-20130205/10473_1 /TAXON_ID=0 /ORGANISM="Stereomyxa ramosa, Strain Chinc5" /LENGTH=252 /DNA_ID=CAMNT_0015345085 /DNA_START=207 /DNA_END=965 /DNA_ORIENTATION=-
MNAISMKMYNEIQDALLKIANDNDLKVAVLTANGKYYSSGNDLANFSKLMHPKKMAKQARDILYGFVDSFITFPKPLLAAVNGPAIGIAVTTLGLCDEVYASETATFHTPFKALGQAPEGCSSFLFPRIMGEKMAEEVLTGGRRLSAKEAKECGFVREVVPFDDLDSLVSKRASSIAKLSPTERSNLRSTTKEPGLVDKLKEVNSTECDILEKAWVSEECFNALQQFLESRKLHGPAFLISLANKTRLLWDH